MTLSDFYNKYKGNHHFNEVIAYLKSEGYSNRDIRFNFIQAKEKYFKYLNNKEKNDPGLIKKIHTFDDGFYIAKLKDKKSIRYEGRVMSNCLSDVNKRMNVYSLRDIFDKSHVSFEIEKMEIIQALGKGNSNVPNKYRLYLIEFAKRFKLKFGQDCRRTLGLTIIPSQMKKIYNGVFSNIKFIDIGNFSYIDNNINVQLKDNIENISFFKKTFDQSIYSLIENIIKFEPNENKILNVLLSIFKEVDKCNNDFFMVFILNELIKNKKESILMDFYQKISKKNVDAWFYDNISEILKLDVKLIIKMISMLSKKFNFEGFIPELFESKLNFFDKKRILQMIISMDGVVKDPISMMGYFQFNNVKENRFLITKAITHYSKRITNKILFDYSTRYLKNQELVEFIMIIKLIRGSFEQDIAVSKNMTEQQIIVLNYLKSHKKINRDVLELKLSNLSSHFYRFRELKVN